MRFAGRASGCIGCRNLSPRREPNLPLGWPGSPAPRNATSPSTALPGDTGTAAPALPLLLIHGFLGYSFSWRFNVEPLSQDFSVYAMDLPGCGFSQRTQTPSARSPAMPRRLLRFMDHLGIEEADIVASSRGGGLAIVLGALLAKRNMLHRIRRLVLVSPINPWSSNGRLLTRVFATTLGGEFVMRVLPKLDIVLTRYFKRLYGDPKRISPGSIEGYERGTRRLPRSFEHLLRIVRSWHADLAACRAVLAGDRRASYCSCCGAHATKLCFPPPSINCNPDSRTARWF